LTIDARNPWWREPSANAAEAVPERRAQLMPELRGSAGFAFWALMGFTFILLLAPQERFPALAPLRIAMLAALLAIAAHGFSRFSRSLPVISFTAPTKILLCLVGWALITAPFSLWPGGSISFLIENFSKTVIVFILLINVVDSRLRLRQISWGLVLMSIPLGVTTIRNFLSGVSLQTGDRVLGYSSGLTANPNDMALMLNLILPLAVGLLLASERTGMRILLAAIAGLIAISIVATFSRAGFLTLMVTGLTYFWLYRNRKERIWIPVILVLGLFALPFMPSGYVSRISTIVNVEEDSTHSAQTRLEDMKAAARLTIASPIVGSGIGMNVLALNEQRGETWTAVHNVYLQYLVELGVPGLVLFLLLYLNCLRTTGTVLRSLNGDESGGLFHLAEGLRVSLIAFAVAAFFHPVAYHFYFYYIAGLAIAAQAIAAQAVALQAAPQAIAPQAMATRVVAGHGKVLS